MTKRACALSVTNKAMALASRVHDETCYILHSYDWSESSLILEAWSRQHGRVALVTKGAKKPNSQWRPVLLPLQALRLDWWGDAEIRTLKSARWAGGPVMPYGDGLLAGLYLNELVMRTMARDDPHPALFDAYALAVSSLRDEVLRSAALRALELHLLKALGVLPSLAVHGTTHKALDDTRAFKLYAEAGLQPSSTHGLDGHTWKRLDGLLQSVDEWSALVETCHHHEPVLRPQLREVLYHHSGLTAFRTRQLWRDVAQVGQRAKAMPETDN